MTLATTTMMSRRAPLTLSADDEATIRGSFAPRFLDVAQRYRLPQLAPLALNALLTALRCGNPAGDSAWSAQVVGRGLNPHSVANVQIEIVTARGQVRSLIGTGSSLSELPIWSSQRHY